MPRAARRLMRTSSPAPACFSPFAHSPAFFSMALSLDDVRRIASLARIAVSEGEAEQALAQLSGIFALIEQMQAVDTHGVAPMSHAQDLVLPLREDRVSEADQR